jgi:CheY-like chemotaxis protein/anti-sigma regulatory factor (Ser/Thr protein kinase)
MSNILVVEDDDITAGLIRHTLAGVGYCVWVETSVEDGWNRLQGREDMDVVLLDRGLPDMDGLELLRRLRGDARLRDIPVVLETTRHDPESVREGVAAGAYFYLPKPLQPPLLLAVVQAAQERRREQLDAQAALRGAGRALLYMDSGTFRYRTLDEARELAHGLARVFPDPARVLLGLQELLINAVEHGNLGIGYDEKTALVLADRWHEEVLRRQLDPVLGRRQVTVYLSRDECTLSLLIQDEGAGFDWHPYLELAPERAFDPHGRGIAMARMTSFDSLDYLGCGNAVQVSMELPRKHWAR